MNTSPDRIGGIQKDILKEIANIGAGHAATALSALLERPIKQSVPDIVFVPLADIPNMLGGADKVVVAGLLGITGDVFGYLIMILDFEQANRIISMVRGKPMQNTEDGGFHKFSVMDKSALSETVNIMGGSYLTAIAEFTGLKVLPSIPCLCMDMVGAVLNIAAAEAGKTGDYAMFFQSELFNNKERIIGNMFFVPDEESCSKILESLGCNCNE